MCSLFPKATFLTFIHSVKSTSDLQLKSYHYPECKDRVGDNHGGVITYVKDTLFCRRRNDLEQHKELNACG